MAKKLIKHGNSLALIIDKPILKMLGITSSTSLQIKTDGKSITIKPEKKKKTGIKAVSRESIIKQLHEDIVEEYEEDFKKLAKN